MPDPARSSQLFLTTATTSNPDTVFVSGPGCDAAGTELFCSLPAVNKKNKSVSVIVAYATPATPTEGENFSVRFEVNTSGATDSDGGTSHGDTIFATRDDDPPPKPDNDDLNFYGAFELEKRPVGNNQSLSGTNPQTTLVELPAGNPAVTVQDGRRGYWQLPGNDHHLLRWAFGDPRRRGCDFPGWLQCPDQVA